MKFKDIYFSKEKYFAVGVEEVSGKYYVSIPVSNSKADYEEYYWIDADAYEAHKSDLGQLEYIADECRNRLRDKDLVFEPGSERGTPV